MRVAAAVIEKDGKVLIARRRGGVLDGLWEFPGGKIEPGETPEVCLVRELQEEFAVVIDVGGFVASNIFPVPSGRIELIAYRATHVSGEFTLLDHDEMQWVKPDELSKYNLAPGDIPIAAEILRTSHRHP